jgi:G6PDH family F420-dependent oxidoreductase
MAAIGYTLSSEEHEPNQLVNFAGLAEQAEFDFAMVSDHFHPWLDSQGNSPFVWSVLGGVATATESLPVGTGVTCPTIRIHPAIIAHAAATAATMMLGRFFLGVGAGERLNEHVLGDHWPPADVRHEMLEEAVAVIRLLWSGERITHHGRHYTVENARLYTVPKSLPPIMVAAGGPQATDLAGRVGDGFVGLVPDPTVIERFERAGGKGKPRYGQVHVCWAERAEDARRTALEYWANGALPGNLFVELAVPEHFQQAVEPFGEEEIAKQIVCGPDPEPHIDAIREFIDAGYDHVYVHQVGPEQEGAIDFYATEVLPELQEGRRDGARQPVAAGARQ